MPANGIAGTKSRSLLLETVFFTAIALTMALVAIPARAASVSPADEAAVRSIVQKTWARYGTTGIPHGPVYDPPRTPELAGLKARCEKLSKTSEANTEGDTFSNCQPTDNPYAFTWDEYRPRLGDVRIVGINPNVIEARLVVVTNAGPAGDSTVMRFVRSASGWLLDDIRDQDGQGKQLGTSMKEFLEIGIEQMQ